MIKSILLVVAANDSTNVSVPPAIAHQRVVVVDLTILRINAVDEQ